jgi:hypothetical protein
VTLHRSARRQHCDIANERRWLEEYRNYLDGEAAAQEPESSSLPNQAPGIFRLHAIVMRGYRRTSKYRTLSWLKGVAVEKQERRSDDPKNGRGQLCKLDCGHKNSILKAGAEKTFAIFGTQNGIARSPAVMRDLSPHPRDC